MNNMAQEQQEGMMRQNAITGREGDGSGGSLNSGDTQGSGGNHPQNSVVLSASGGGGTQTAEGEVSESTVDGLLDQTINADNAKYDADEERGKVKDPTFRSGKRRRESGKKFASVCG